MEAAGNAVLTFQLEVTLAAGAAGPVTYRFYALRWPDGTETLAPSVTTILRVSGQIPARFMQSPEARTLGTAVAWATEALEYGGPPPADPLVARHTESYERFIMESRCQVIDVESVVASRDPLYAGRCDRIVRLNGQEIVLELKTGQPAAWHKLQAAAYASATGKGAGLLYLKPEGYRFVPLSLQDVDLCAATFNECARMVAAGLKVSLIRHAEVPVSSAAPAGVGG